MDKKEYVMETKSDEKRIVFLNYTVFASKTDRKLIFGVVNFLRIVYNALCISDIPRFGGMIDL